ncbi:unnamed protein product [Prorocentrum cordatum]|uniref:Uncharacterized protein n=1 Tax=Prorocentrum cordatum TaxID=2364126 RepID=A0ABN9T888_9DINO|nr:unnamed protein product [Polarella glacialis]
MPEGELYVRSHNFNRVPPNVGEPRKNVKLHVRDDYRAHEDPRPHCDAEEVLHGTVVFPGLMGRTPPPFCSGAIIFHCDAGSAKVDEFREELQNMLGKDSLPVTSATLRGEIGPAGVHLGGIDARPTDRSMATRHSPASSATARQTR